MSYVYEWTSEWVTSNVNVNSAPPDDWTAIASIANSVCVDYWTAEWVIIASNVNSVHVDDWTVEWVIIASKGSKKGRICDSVIFCSLLTRHLVEMTHHFFKMVASILEIKNFVKLS